MSATPDRPDADARAADPLAEPLTAVPRISLVDGHLHSADADEPMGGDPPCWAHLFEEDDDGPAS